LGSASSSPPARPGDNAGTNSFTVVTSGGGGEGGRTTTPATAFGSLVDELQSRPSARGLGTHARQQKFIARVGRPYPPGLPPLVYPKVWEVRQVRTRGTSNGMATAVHRSGFCGQSLGLKLRRSALEVYLGKQLTANSTTRMQASAPARWQPSGHEGVTVLPCLSLLCHPCPFTVQARVLPPPQG